MPGRVYIESGTHIYASVPAGVEIQGSAEANVTIKPASPTTTYLSVGAGGELQNLTILDKYSYDRFGGAARKIGWYANKTDVARNPYFGTADAMYLEAGVSPALSFLRFGSFIDDLDLWGGGVHIYDCFKLYMKSPLTPYRVFAASIDFDVSDKTGPTSEGDTVALYVQTKGNAATTSHIFAFNAVAVKNSTATIHCVELDMNNMCGVDDPPWGGAGSGILLDIEPGISTNWIATAIGMNGPADGGAGGIKGFRQAIHCDYAFDTVGLFLRACKSDPDSYIDMIPYDDLNPSSYMIKIQNAAYSKVVWGITKNGVILFDNPLAGVNARIVSMFSDNNGYFNIANWTDGKTLVLFNAINQQVGFYNTISSTVTTAETATFFVGLKNTETFGRVGLNEYGLDIGPGTAGGDVNIYRTAANTITISASVSVKFGCANLLPSVWPCDIGSGGSNFRSLYVSGDGGVGALYVSTTQVITSGRTLQNVTANASIINAGIFDVARIPDLDADKITSGVLGTSRIPNLSASKLTSGTLDRARLDGMTGTVANPTSITIDHGLVTACS